MIRRRWKAYLRKRKRLFYERRYGTRRPVFVIESIVLSPAELVDGVWRREEAK